MKVDPLIWDKNVEECDITYMVISSKLQPQPMHSSYGIFFTSQDHLALMMELLGMMPRKVLL